METTPCKSIVKGEIVTHLCKRS